MVVAKVSNWWMIDDPSPSGLGVVLVKDCRQEVMENATLRTDAIIRIKIEFLKKRFTRIMFGSSNLKGISFSSPITLTFLFGPSVFASLIVNIKFLPRYRTYPRRSVNNIPSYAAVQEKPNTSAKI